MPRVHLEHWWISESEILALNTLRASLADAGITLCDDPAKADEADVCAALMPAHRIWDGLCGIGSRPLPLAAHVTPFDIQHRLFQPFRAVDTPSRLALFGIPIGVSRCNTMWVNRRIAERCGGRPADAHGLHRWLVDASKVVRHPLCVSPEDWSVGLLFETVMLSLCGSDLHRNAFGMGAAGAVASDGVRESLEYMRELRGLVAPEDTVGAWHQAAARCQEGSSAAIVMGEWTHNEFRRKTSCALHDYEATYKWVFPGTDMAFVYNVDYIVPIERRHKATNDEVLGTLTRALLSPELQSDFGLIKGAHPAVRDASHANIDPDAHKLFHLATLSPSLFVPSMSLLQCTPATVRAAIAESVRGLLYRDGDVETAHERIQEACHYQASPRSDRARPTQLPRSLSDEHHCGQSHIDRLAAVAARAG